MFFGATVSEQQESKSEIALILYNSIFLQNTSFRSVHKIIRGSRELSDKFVCLFVYQRLRFFFWKQSYSFDSLKLLKSGPLLWHLYKKHILLKSDYITNTIFKIQRLCLKSWLVFFFKIENKKMFWWLQTSLNKCYQKLWSQKSDVSYTANLIVLPGMFPLNGSHFDRDC